MQLLAIVLYNADGRMRRLDFEPGALNIVTGQSETGKSALLTIIDYCLGRDSMRVPVGIISRTVAWYGALWEVEGTGPEALRAFVGRPRPEEGRQSTSRAMVELGVGLEPPAFEALQPNSDTTQLRQQLGRRIGIDESAVERSWGRSPDGFEANLAHATLLCLQNQSEVANQAFMFHRQGETGMEQALRDTIPFFLGAVPRDQARKRVMLREARRNLNRLQEQYEQARRDAGTIDVELRALMAEARSVGLLPAAEPASGDAPDAARGSEERPSRADVIRVLTEARSNAQPQSQDNVIEQQDRVDELEAQRVRLDRDLRETLDERALLLRESRATNEVFAALDQQRGRLTSLGLIEATAVVQPEAAAEAHASEVDPGIELSEGVEASAEDAGGDPHSDDADEGPTADTHGEPASEATSTEANVDRLPETEAHDCPVCRSRLTEPDPTALALQRGLAALSNQIVTVSTARPANRRALQGLNERVDQLREQLRAVDSAVADLTRADRLARENELSRRDFTRGRIDAIVSRASVVDTFMVEALAEQVQAAREQVTILEGELAEYTANQSELNARLRVVGDFIREYASTLALEHSAGAVMLDLTQLTVLADTPEGTAPLSRIGSAKNWVGYHLATHLALHNFFVSRNRPVPRFLILDQPTQAHYPADDDNESGEPSPDADRVAVRQMFRLMHDFVDGFGSGFQIIVCDHADLPEDWFQHAVRHRWREGRANSSDIPALIPADWITDNNSEADADTTDADAGDDEVDGHGGHQPDQG